jgi:sugar lactone lactonase YvrE
MVFDTGGFLYVATRLGVQVFDPGGRMRAMIGAPGADGVSDVFFGGPDMKWLYATDGNRIYRRPSKRRGATAWTRAKRPHSQ